MLRVDTIQDKNKSKISVPLTLYLLTLLHGFRVSILPLNGVCDLGLLTSTRDEYLSVHPKRRTTEHTVIVGYNHGRETYTNEVIDIL